MGNGKPLRTEAPRPHTNRRRKPYSQQDPQITNLTGYLKAIWTKFVWRHENGLIIGPPGRFSVQPALHDEPHRSGEVLGPSLAENRPTTDPAISGQTAFKYPVFENVSRGV